MNGINRRSLLAGLATVAVAPALPRLGPVKSAVGIDVAGPDGAIIVRAMEGIPRWAAVSQVSYRGMIYVERAVK